MADTLRQDKLAFFLQDRENTEIDLKIHTTMVVLKKKKFCNFAWRVCT